MNLNLNVTSNASKAESSFNKLTNTLKGTSSAYGEFYNKQRKVNNSLSNITKDANRSADGFKGMTKAFSEFNQIIGITKLYGLAQSIASCITASMDATETTNLFSVSLGNMADTAYNSLKSISLLTGMDLTNLESATGTFALLARSMGMTDNQAEKLAVSTSKLGLDLSSLMNVPVNQVMADLRSGLLGQTETVYKYGIDLTEASLAQEALNQGITKSVRNMSQGEKMALRYSVMIKQTALAHGDFARTIDTPSNQLRILHERFISLARAIGNIFIPILSAILPYANAVVMILTDLANAIAKFFGYKAPEVQKMPSSIGKVGSAMDNTSVSVGKASKAMDKASKSAKKMQNALLGIDEINLLPQSTSTEDVGTSGAGGAGGGGGLGSPSILPEIDFGDLSNGLDGIKSKADEIKQKFIEWLVNLKPVAIIVGEIGLLFLSWKLATWLLDLEGGFKILKTISRLLSDIRGFIALVKEFGLGATLAGLAPKLLKIAQVAGGIFLVINGIILAFTGLRDILKETKPPLEDFLKLFAGIALIGGGISLAFGSWIPLVVGLIVGAVTSIAFYVYKYWDEIKTKTIKIWTYIKKWFIKNLENLKTKVNDTLTSIKEFFSTKFTEIQNFIVIKIPEIINNIVEWFSDLPNKISEKLTGALNSVTTWISNMVITIQTEFPKVINKIGEFLSTLPDKIAYWLGFALGTIVKWVIDMVKTVQTEVPKIISEVGKFMSELPSKIYNWIIGTKDKVVQWGNDVKNTFFIKITEIKNSISTWLSDVGTRVYNSIINTKDKVVQWGNDVKNTFSIKITEIKNSVTSWFSSLPSNILGAINGVYSKILTWKSNVITWFSQVVPSILTSVANSFKTLPSKIYSAITGMYSTIRSIGTYILDGIMDGLSAIGNRIKRWTSSFVNGFKTALGIKSPSRVMRDEVGKFLGEGIEVGLDNTQKDIVGTALKISDGIQSAFSDIGINPNVEYSVSEVNIPNMNSDMGITGSVVNSATIESNVMVDGIYNAVFNAISNAMRKEEETGDIVLKVDNTEFGRIAIKSINTVTRQQGKLSLEI